MGYRDKWSVCTMAADVLASEIWKFRLQTCEYDQSKPPGKDEDGNDLPPLSIKEKSRRARMLFVERVQTFHGATITELSQSSSLKLSTKMSAVGVKPEAMFNSRANTEEKPTLTQWFALKSHVEHHFYRTVWDFPQGVSFLSWVSALRPYLNQKTMKEEMAATITGLVEQDKMAPITDTRPLSEKTADMIRGALATNLGLKPTQLDGVRDDIRLLQRNVVLQLAEENKKRVAEKAKADGGANAADELKVDENMTDEEYLREVIMDLQGLGKPKEEEGENLLRIRKNQKKLVTKSSVREMEDDYLAGPMSVDTYMVYRVRPLTERLQTKVNRLSFRLSVIDVAGFVIQSSGSVLAYFHFGEWVALTVALASVLQAFVEFMQLRDQVTSLNLALRDLQGLAIFWDSISIVRRRTPAVKMQVVSTTENAYQLVVNAHTTAAANAITSVAKQLEVGEGDEEAKKEE